jgi:uncharacterized protein
LAGSSAELHEPEGRLRAETIDRHRAIVSLIEELEAIDWYDQRVDAADDDDLRRVLMHNRDEEKEHACMALEWLRRRDPALDGFMRRYLFTDEPVADVAEAAEADVVPAPSLAIGSLR